MPIADVDNFSLRDVCDEFLSDFANNLEECFFYADDTKFDPKYNSNGQELRDFRNYGHSMDIGNQIDEDQIVSGAVYLNTWLEGDPDTGQVFLIYINAGTYTLSNIYVGSTSIFYGYDISLGSNSPTDFFVVDSDHVYVADKYQSGGSYYFRVRWYEFVAGSWSLVDTDTVSVSSTVYNLKNPKIAAIDGYIWVTNFNNSTSTNYVYSMTVGTMFGTKVERLTFTGTNVTLETIYAFGGIFYISQDTGTNNYIFTYSISSGGLSTKDNSITTNTIHKIRASFDTAAYALSISNALIYLTHDSDGDNIIIQDERTGSGIDIDVDPVYNRPIVVSSSFLIAYSIDGNDDLYLVDNDQQCVQGGDIFTIQAVCSNIGTYDAVVAIGYTTSGTNRQHIFYFPVT